MPVMKEVVSDTASGDKWVNRTVPQVSQTGVDGITSGNIHHDISVFKPPSPVLIEIIATPHPVEHISTR